MIKQLLFSLLLVITVSFKAQTTIVDSIYTGGMYRTYRLYVPAVYNGTTARPLILNLHGYTSNASSQQLYSNFMPIADTANFLMVYPQGTTYNSQPYWNAGISSTGVDDISFLSNLIDSLSAQYNINPNRIYSTGMSNGGFMSHTLACELSNRIAAIASVTGSIFITQYGSNCHPTRPVPVMQISGTADGTVPYAGNTTMEPIDTVVKYWVRYNNCNTTPSFSNVPNTNTTDGCTAEHYRYLNGNSGSSVELYKIIGGGHTWPGSPYTTGVTNRDMNASKEIWRFFSKYSLNTLTAVADLTDNKIRLSVYPNPSCSKIHLIFEKQMNSTYTVVLTDVLGNKTISEFKENSLNLEQLSSGIYILSLLKNGVEVAQTKIIKQ